MQLVRERTRSAAVQGAVATSRPDCGCEVSFPFANCVLDEFALHLEHALQLLFEATSVIYCVVERWMLAHFGVHTQDEITGNEF